MTHTGVILWELVVPSRTAYRPFIITGKFNSC